MVNLVRQAVGHIYAYPDRVFEGWDKEYNPVLASPKVVIKVEEPVVDVVLSVS